jgi:hypothetical protein
LKHKVISLENGWNEIYKYGDPNTYEKFKANKIDIEIQTQLKKLEQAKQDLLCKTIRKQLIKEEA